MAKKAFIGVDGKARKVKKGYIGVDNKARKVKKAYIGVGGVARPCFTGGELAYYGTITSFNKWKKNHAAATVGNYAIFGDGNYGSSPVTGVMDVYNVSLTHSSTSVVHSLIAYATTTVGNHAIFAGGSGATKLHYSDEVTAYDTSLTGSKLSKLEISRRALAGATVGNYAIFGGGRERNSSTSWNVDTVDVYDTNLTKVSLSKYLSVDRSGLKAATVGNYALFGGAGTSLEVDAYNSSLTKTEAPSFSEGKSNYAAVTVGGYALFAGGLSTSSTVMITVEAYNASLTKSLPTGLSLARQGIGATTIGNYAIFGGGRPSNSPSVSDVTNTVEVFNESLTRTILIPLSENRESPAVATVGNYALFGGGGNGTMSGSASIYASKIVDVYTIQ